MVLLKRFLRTFRQVRRSLNILLGVSVLLILCIEFWWKHEPAMFGWQDASEGADLAVNFLLSYVASYIFFFVGDHWDRATDLENIEPAVLKRVVALMYLFTDPLRYTVHSKRYTSFADRPLASITREEWPLLQAEMFWVKEGSRPDNASFAAVNIRWMKYGERAHKPADMVIDDFGSYDSKLNALLDTLRQNASQLAGLKTANEIYDERYTVRLADVPISQNFHQSFAFWTCFDVHEAIQEGRKLIEYARPFKTKDDKVRILVETCLKSLNDVSDVIVRPDRQGPHSEPSDHSDPLQ